MSERILEELAEAIHERHGFRVVALDMSAVPLTMEAFLIASAENRVQARAISDNVERRARELGFRRHHVEGYEEGSWILLDFVDLVVHVFLVPTREYYDLEMLWSDVPRLEYDDGEAPPDERSFGTPE